MQTRVAKAFAEAVGTFILVFMGCGSMMVTERFPGSIPAFAIPLIFGLTVASMVYAIGHISGAHFNPAVTFAFALSRHFPKKDILSYWVAQILGAILAIGLLFLILPEGKTFGATLPHVPAIHAVIWESVLTFNLMFVIVAVATDLRINKAVTGAAIGAAVAIGAFVGGPITGASMNPARSLAPAIFQGTLNNLWIYFTGPFIGALLAALLYQRIKK